MSYNVKGLRYPSFYIKDYEKAVAFYTTVLGPPQNDDDRIKGWFLGDSWLTLFPAEDLGHDPETNPRNAEFAIEVSAPGEVDRLYDAMLAAGATTCMAPEDTRMYEPMRFCAVDDPVSIRIDVFCPIQKKD
jgi:catechol 2,3-dioxygenase-like lactoylglutathione lyase family enzyme